MRTSELNRIAAYVCALAMGVCAVCGSQAVFGADEPNSPAPTDANALWDPATHFAPQWTSVSLTTRIDGPHDSLSRLGVPQDLRYSRNLSISGEVDIIDSNGLVALTPTLADLLVMDESGLEIPDTSNSSSRSLLRLYQALPPRVSPARAGQAAFILPYTFNASLSIDPNAAWPQLVSRLEWSAYALLARAEEVVDVPFKVTPDWIRLVPGLEILVTQATVEGNKYEYIIRSRYDPSQVVYLLDTTVFIHEAEKLADRMVIETQILNAEGYPPGGTTGSSTRRSISPGSGPDGQKTYTINGEGTCSDCGTATTFRYRFAAGPYQQRVRFVIEDIPVPSF